VTILAGCGADEQKPVENDPAAKAAAPGDGIGQPFGGPLAPDATLHEALIHPDPLARIHRVAEILQAATPEQLPDIQAEFERAPQAWGDLEYALFIGWWARFDPKLAMAYAETDIRSDHPRVYSEAMRMWARKDPKGAIDSGWLVSASMGYSGWRAEIVEAIVTGWFESGNPGLEEWLSTGVEPNSALAAQRAYIRMRVLRDGGKSALEWARTAPFPPEQQRLLFANGLNAVARMDPKLAIEYLGIAEQDGIDVRSFVARIARGWANLDPSAAMTWVVSTKVDPMERERAIMDVARIWLLRDEPTFGDWLAAHRGEPGMDLLHKQAIYHHVTTNDYHVDWQDLMKQASEFRDEEERKMEYLWLIQRWRRMQPEPAEAWLAANSELLGDKLEFADQLFKHESEAIERILAEDARRAASAKP